MRKALAVLVLAVVAGPGAAQPGAVLPAPAGNAPGGGVALLLPGGVQPSGFPQDGYTVPGNLDPAEGGSGGPNGQFWLRGEYLLWWTEGSRLPPLVTSGLPGLTPLPGVLGQPGTTVSYGNSGGDDGPRSGGRFTGGLWLDPCRTFGLEGSYFFLASRTTRFDAASDAALGSAVIARPFFDVLTGSQNAQLVAFPALANGTNVLTATGSGLARGAVHASTYSRLQGADVNALCPVCSGCNYWVQALAGFRYLNLEEGVAVAEVTRVNPALPTGSPFFGGSTIAISDRFDTRNNFYGGQVGIRGEARWGRAFVGAQTKIALGVTNQVIDISGSTAITPPGGATTATPVGFLASGSNSGRHARNVFSAVPEVGVNAGLLVTSHLRVFTGYNFLYWSSVVRPADQIDLGLSGTRIPTDTRYNPGTGPARPGTPFRDTGFWAQGVTFGAELAF